MSLKHSRGRGRLVPTRQTGLEYEVQYRIHLPEDVQKHGRDLQTVRWAKCSLHSACARRIPDGSYFLHAEDGRVHQLKSVDGEWSHLAFTAGPHFASSGDGRSRSV